MESKFLADSMLGRLARWLRIMGYDTHYQTAYVGDRMKELIHEGRSLLSRRKKSVDMYPQAVLIRSDHVGKQLHEVVTGLSLEPATSSWFSRCLICNIPLEFPSVETAHESLPRHVLYQNPTGIRFCASCGRNYWPGSHRERMLLQLKEWGF